MLIKALFLVIFTSSLQAAEIPVLTLPTPAASRDFLAELESASHQMQGLILELAELERLPELEKRRAALVSRYQPIFELSFAEDPSAELQQWFEERNAQGIRPALEETISLTDLEIRELLLREEKALEELKSRASPEDQQDPQKIFWENEYQISRLHRLFQQVKHRNLSRKRASQKREELSRRLREAGSKYFENTKSLEQELAALQSLALKSVSPDLKALRETLLREKIRQLKAQQDSLQLNLHLVTLEEKIFSPPLEGEWVSRQLDEEKKRERFLSQQKEILEERKKVFEEIQSRVKEESPLTTVSSGLLGSPLAPPPDLEEKMALARDLINLVGGQIVLMEEDLKKEAHTLEALLVLSPPADFWALLKEKWDQVIRWVK